MLTKNELKLYRSLLTRHGRKKNSFCVCEGIKCCLELYKARSDLIHKAFFAGVEPPAQLFQGLILEEIGAEQMKQISPSASSKGIVFIAHRPEFAKFADAVVVPFAVLLDRIQDPGNLGTIIRGVKAAGLNHIFLSNDCADPFSEKVIRAAGSLQFSMNLFEYEDLNPFLDKLTNKGCKNLFLSSVRGGENIYGIDELFDKSAIVFGNEGAGLPPNLNGRKFTIPMPGKTESLNVAQALTITIFEFVRRKLIIHR